MKNEIKPIEQFFAVLSLFISFISLVVFVLSSVYPKRYMDYINITALFLSVESFAVGMELLLLKNKKTAVAWTVLIITILFLLFWLLPSLDSYLYLLPAWVSIVVIVILTPTAIIFSVKNIKHKRNK